MTPFDPNELIASYREAPGAGEVALREALERATRAMDSVSVFVTSRERIKRPEGEEWWREEIAEAKAAITRSYVSSPSRNSAQQEVGK
jgi:hypothetical protein